MESAPSAAPVRFGAFELDFRARELRTGARRIRLQEQPFEILRLMLEHPGEVVTRDRLRDHLWPQGTFVDFEHSLNAAVKRLRAALGDDAENPRFVETVPRRGYRFIAPLSGAAAAQPAAPAEQPRVRLAVLPFSNLSADPAQEYFSDGLTEEMIAQLGALCRGRVGVLARWSSMVFKGTTRRAREIGELLQADYLLEGSVRREGLRLRITASLVETAGETHLWSDTYERSLDDCLSVQADVAAHISRSLATELMPHQASVRGRCDPAAYQHYLKGRYYWNKSMDGGQSPMRRAPSDTYTPSAADVLAEATACYERALAIAPSLAAAHAALARAWVARAEYYHEHPCLGFERARASVTRARSLDASDYEALVADADLRRMHDFDWSGAAAAYAQAIAVNPSGETAHRKTAVMLAVQGRHAEALRAADRASDLDPLCAIVATTGAWVAYVGGDVDAAIAECLTTLDMYPTVVSARRLLGAAYVQAGALAPALDALQAAAQHGDDPVTLAWLAHAQAVAGRVTEAEALVGRLRELESARYVPPFHLALAYAGLGDRDAAFACLERAWRDRDAALATVVVEPRFEVLRGDVRFAALRRQLGL